MKKTRVVTILLLSFMAALIFTAVPVNGAATISTDKLDYTPGERVAIFGSGFFYNVQVTVSVTRPDSTVNTIYATTDWSGAFTCNYQLDGIMGVYTVTATDGTNTAATIFTDCQPSYSVYLITVNGVPYPWPTYVSNPVEFYGNFSAHPGAGLEKQYGLRIDWGDGTNTTWKWSDTNHAIPYLTWNPLDSNSDTFNGTFNTNPGGGYPDMGHTYATGGLYVETILFFHGQPSGAESADAAFTISTEVLIPEISVSKSGPTSAHQGDSITYTITVTNPSSDTTMYKVSVIDSILGNISGSFSASLAPLASETKTFSHMVPTTGSNITNTVTVTYKDLANETKTASASWTVTIQYYLAVNSPHDTPGGAGWYNGGSTAYATLVDGVVSGGSGIQYVFTGWSGDASGTGLMSNGILMDGSKTATAQWKTQYYIAFGQSGVGSDYAGTFVTIDGTPYDRNGAAFWWDANSVHTFSFASPLSVAGGKQYVWTSTSGLIAVQTGSLTVTGSGSVTGYYKTQYYVTFDETGVGSDFTGTVVTIDGTNYAVAGLPVSFWYDGGSSHSFSFASPLTVDASKQYAWDSTSGLSTVQTGSLTATASGSVVGNYILENAITFDQLGVGSDFTGTVVTVDGIPYGVSSLPISFNWPVGSTHNFAFPSPLVVTANAKRYVWTSTTGLSSVQSGSITVTTSGSVVGSFKTQYYLTLATSPSGVYSPTGAGWYDSGTYASISTVQYVDIVSGSSRYSFTGWTTGVMGEIADPSAASTTVFMDQAKTVTANYVIQYYLTVRASPLGVDSPAGEDWYDAGSSASISTAEYVDIVPGSSRYRFNGWNTVDMSEIANPSLASTTVHMDKAKTVTANYVIQYYLTMSTNFGTNSPGDGWHDASSTVTISATPPSAVSGERYVWNGWTGSGSGSYAGTANPAAVTMNAAITETASWTHQYFLTVNSSYDTPGGAGWYNTGSTAYATLVDGVVSGGSGIQYVFTGWSGDASGTGLMSNGILMDGSKTATAQWKTQYYIVFGQSGVGSDYAGTVVTIDGTSYYDRDGAAFRWDANSVHTFSFASPLSVAGGKQYVWISTGGLSTDEFGSLTVTGSGSVTGYYKTQYYVTFDETGVGGDFTGTVITIDGTNYAVAGLPVSFWYDGGSSHSFSFASPLSVSAGKQYAWSSTSGLSTVQTGSLTVAASGSVVGNYILENAITFDQTGVSSDFTGTVVTVDGVSYGVSLLPASFYWSAGSTHSFAFQSPLVVTPNAKQYVWTSTAGLSSVQSGSITVTTYGNIVGNFKTQYYLTLATSPSGVDSPTGAGWYDSGTYASISTDEYEAIVSGSSRYRFNGWITGFMSEIADPSAASTTVFMDQAETVTAVYVIQYYIAFGQSGVGSDYGGVVVTIDGTNYGGSGASFWWDVNSVHPFSFGSPLSVAGGKRYVWTSTSGLSTVQTGSLTVTGSGSVTGYCKTQYYVTFDETGVGGDFTGTVITIDGTNYAVAGLPVSFWYDGGSSHSFSFASPLSVSAGKQYAWSSTFGLSAVQAGSLTVTASGSVIGNYIVQNAIIFDQLGVSSDFTGAVVTVDGIPYGVSSLPISFNWPVGSTHSFAFPSPLVVAANVKRYVWTGTSGLSSVQSDLMTVATFGSMVGNFKIQYYLIVKTDPPGFVAIPGQGWYDSGNTPTLKAPAVAGPEENSFWYWDVDIVSQGRNVNNITVTMNMAHTATAHYWVPGVGGEWIPIRAVQLLTLCIGFAATMVLAASFVGIRRFKKRQI